MFTIETTDTILKTFTNTVAKLHKRSDWCNEKASNLQLELLKLTEDKDTLEQEARRATTISNKIEEFIL
jgi:hypothetical protein